MKIACKMGLLENVLIFCSILPLSVATYVLLLITWFVVFDREISNSQDRKNSLKMFISGLRCPIGGCFVTNYLCHLFGWFIIVVHSLIISWGKNGLIHFTRWQVKAYIKWIITDPNRQYKINIKKSSF